MIKKITSSIFIVGFLVGPLSAQEILLESEAFSLQDQCAMDIDLANYADALLHDREPPEGMDESHAAQIRSMLDQDETLSNNGRFRKVIDACGAGTILQGRYGS